MHYWADMQSVHELRCYDNITRTRNISEYMLVLTLCLVCFVSYTTAPTHAANVFLIAYVPAECRVPRWNEICCGAVVENYCGVDQRRCARNSDAGCRSSTDRQATARGGQCVRQNCTCRRPTSAYCPEIRAISRRRLRSRRSLKSRAKTLVNATPARYVAGWSASLRQCEHSDRRQLRAYLRACLYITVHR